MIEELGALQQVINTATFGGQLDSDWYYVGWGKVNLIEDLSLIMPQDQRPDTTALAETWEPAAKRMREWGSEDGAEEQAARDAERAMQAVIAELRKKIRIALQMLE